MLLSKAFVSFHEPRGKPNAPSTCNKGSGNACGNPCNNTLNNRNRTYELRHDKMPSNTCTSSTGGCTHSPEGFELYPLMDPKYNFRQVAGQLLLLEGHLSSQRSRCQDCVMKHALTAENLASEALCMTSDPEVHKEGEALLASIIEIESKLAQNELSPELSQQIRQIRKKLVKETFNYQKLFQCGKNDGGTSVCAIKDSM